MELLARRRHIAVRPIAADKRRDRRVAVGNGEGGREMIAVGLDWDRESRDRVSIRLLGNRVGGRAMIAVGLERWDRKSRGRVSIASKHWHPVLILRSILLSTCLACLRPLTHQPRHTYTRTYIYTHQPRPVSKLASLIYVQFHSFPAPCFRHINAHASWQLFQCFASLASASPSPPPPARTSAPTRDRWSNFSTAR